jgi:hypothetical protein
MEPLFKIQRFFDNFYSRITDVEVQPEELPLYSYSKSVNAIRGRNKVVMRLEFYSLEGVEDLAKFAEEQEYEERLRERNPTLQKAYEEYQILLKLIK